MLLHTLRAVEAMLRFAYMPRRCRAASAITLIYMLRDARFRYFAAAAALFSPCCLFQVAHFSPPDLIFRAATSLRRRFLPCLWYPLTQ